MFYLLIVRFQLKDINKTIQMFFEEFAKNRDCCFGFFYFGFHLIAIKEVIAIRHATNNLKCTKLATNPKNTRVASIKLLTIYAIFLCVDLNKTK